MNLIIIGNIDVMVIGESKLHCSYLTSQFLIDRNSNGVGLLLYVREDIPCRQLSDHSLPADIDGMFIELNFRKSKGVVITRLTSKINIF